MARPLRITYEDAFYHVTARGNERKKIFLSRTDYEKFLSYLRDALRKYGASPLIVRIISVTLFSF
jgi:REP element-mobilizing transposase RayT